MDELLLVLRVLTFGVRVALVAGLMYVVAARGPELPLRRRLAWIGITVVILIVTVNYVMVEALNLAAAVRPFEATGRAIHAWVYHATYLINALLFGILPSLLIFVSAPRKALRMIFAGLISLAGIFAVWAAVRGALDDWGVLLSWSQVIAFVGIAGYLSFCAFALLGRLPGVDAYVFGFVLIQTIFELLIPVQEAFFQAVGRDGSGQIWSINQFLQFSMILAQVIVILAFINSIRTRGGSVPRQGLVPAG